MPKFALRKVVHRRPRPFVPHASAPKYLACYVTETLECGHTLDVFPQSDPLIAVRRHCQRCDELKVVSIDEARKPPLSVRLEVVKKRA